MLLDSKIPQLLPMLKKGDREPALEFKHYAQGVIVSTTGNLVYQEILNHSKSNLK